MPAGRRSELLAWAAETGTVLIEDDFNAELRYRLAPQPPLAALSTAADVFILGTFSTLLAVTFQPATLSLPRPSPKLCAKRGRSWACRCLL